MPGPLGLARLARPPCPLCSRAASRSTRVLTSGPLRLRLDQRATLAPTAHSLRHLLDAAASPARLYSLVRTELPIRLARLATALPACLPGPVKEQRVAQFVQDYYEMSFLEVDGFPPEALEPAQEKKWLETLHRIGIRLGGSTEMLSEAVLGSGVLGDTETCRELQRDLPSVLRQNISADVLISLCRPARQGFLQPENDLLADATAAYDDARYLCEQHYLACPKLTVSSHSPATVIFPSVPSYNYLIMFEIFKNALRATVETHEDEAPPPVELRLWDEGQMLVAEIADQGSGMEEEQLERATRFFTTSAVLDDMSLYQGAHSSPLAGHGFGLGLASLYCAYWGGGLAVRSDHGQGTVVRMHWCRDADQARESV